MKVRLEFVGNITFAFMGGYKGMAICSEHDRRDYAMGAAVALLKARPRFNAAAKTCIESLEELFPHDEFLRHLLITSRLELTDNEVMSYCMIRAELTNRVREASKIEEAWEADVGKLPMYDNCKLIRRRRGPDNALIVEDCARKLVKACPNLARLS